MNVDIRIIALVIFWSQGTFGSQLSLLTFHIDAETSYRLLVAMVATVNFLRTVNQNQQQIISSLLILACY